MAHNQDTADVGGHNHVGLSLPLPPTSTEIRSPSHSSAQVNVLPQATVESNDLEGEEDHWAEAQEVVTDEQPEPTVDYYTVGDPATTATPEHDTPVDVGLMLDRDRPLRKCRLRKVNYKI
ncbi:hypothetical protein JYU34_000722 [Plutella xylostella]|uniref:Uncharacterized protein n=1 Tax=Plutella xylostella TaxID=51655 RepID=A0ABQ7R8D8_PLUXY|nr:hypothetical protein JYU34_000722 [Plutella xylostella]